MIGKTWMRNARGEWYVITQAALMFVVIVAPAFDAPPWSRSEEIAAIVGGLLCVTGLSFVILGTIGLGRNLSPFPRPKEISSLVENGIFAIVRHPIYSGFSLSAFGWSLIWNSIAGLIAAVVLLIFFDRKARREERWLEAKFEHYPAYRNRVRKLIPFVY